jgi:hypothetical protein
LPNVFPVLETANPLGAVFLDEDDAGENRPHMLTIRQGIGALSS